MKKTLGIGVGAVLAAMSVHAAVSGATSYVNTFPGGGTPVNPNPTFYGNCTAALQKFAVGPDGGPDYSYVLDWTTVQASSPSECNAIVNSYLNRTSGGFWRLSPYLPRCACHSPGMGRVIDLGADTVSWTAEQDAALDAELLELKTEYRIDEYYTRVRELVEERIQPVEGAR